MIVFEEDDGSITIDISAVESTHASGVRVYYHMIFDGNPALATVIIDIDLYGFIWALDRSTQTIEAPTGISFGP